MSSFPLGFAMAVSSACICSVGTVVLTVSGATFGRQRLSTLRPLSMGPPAGLPVPRGLCYRLNYAPPPNTHTTKCIPMC